MRLITTEQEVVVRAPFSHQVFLSLSHSQTLFALPLAIQILLSSHLFYLQQAHMAHLQQPYMYSQHSDIDQDL